MANKAIYGYLAGLLDGEGHISISRGTYTKRKLRSDGTLYEKPNCIHYMINIGITNTNIKLMKWLKQRFGGTYYPLKRDDKPNWKISYKWQYTKQNDAEILLLSVLPYLVIKREQALVLLSFVRLKDTFNPELRFNLYSKIRQLNDRGISVETNMLESSSYEIEDKIESELISNDKSTPVVIQEV